MIARVILMVWGHAALGGLILAALGVGDNPVRYDWRTERWVYTPSRFDLQIMNLIRV